MLEQTQRGNLDITTWLSWFLDCLFHAMDHTEETLRAIANRTQFWGKNRGVPLNSRQQYMVNALLDDFFGKLTTTKWAKMTKSSPDTGLRDIQDLIEKGIIPNCGLGSRWIGINIVDYTFQFGIAAIFKLAQVKVCLLTKQVVFKQAPLAIAAFLDPGHIY